MSHRNCFDRGTRGTDLDMTPNQSAVSSGQRPLEGAAALVTGATSGLGRATALQLADAGVHVALLGRTEAALQHVADSVADQGGQAVCLAVDLADTAALPGVVDDVVAQLGALDIVVNAAGTDVPGAAEELTLEDWDRVLAVNLTAPFQLSRAAMPHLRRRGGGLVVNVSSVAGRRGWANASAYCATKFALTGLTQALAAEGREHGIRVCVLYPGAMATNWGTFDPAERTVATDAEQGSVDERDALRPDTVADLIVWMAASPGRPVLNEVTITPLREAGWP